MGRVLRAGKKAKERKKSEKEREIKTYFHADLDTKILLCAYQDERVVVTNDAFGLPEAVAKKKSRRRKNPFIMFLVFSFPRSGRTTTMTTALTGQMWRVTDPKTNFHRRAESSFLLLPLRVKKEASPKKSFVARHWTGSDHGSKIQACNNFHSSSQRTFHPFLLKTDNVTNIFLRLGY